MRHFHGENIVEYKKKCNFAEEKLRKMKKWLIFGGGVFTGVLLTVLLCVIVGNRSRNHATWFESPGDVINEKAFKVFHVIEKDAALVDDLFPGTIYMLTNKEGKYYYDDQIIEVPEDKEVRQVGIYKYETKSKLVKTVPIIRIMDK